ncbi:laccase-5-like [Populus alba x Populus x berolinensis]|nr:laccase-5-like [Populus alba x Populus x berolinensis]
METRNLTVKQVSYCLFLSIFVIFCFQAHFSEAETHYREFVIQAKPVKRLCRTHNTITVNGLFPGPTLEVRDGDTLVIKAVNNARYNVTLHW